MKAARQRGGVLFWVIYGLVFGLLIVEIIHVAPAYYTHEKVKSIIESIPEKLRAIAKGTGSGLTFKDEIRRIVIVNFRINGIDNVSPDNLKLKRTKDDKVIVEFSYEVREKLFFNIDTVISFSDSVVVPYQ